MKLGHKTTAVQAGQVPVLVKEAHSAWIQRPLTVWIVAFWVQALEQDLLHPQLPHLRSIVGEQDQHRKLVLEHSPRTRSTASLPIGSLVVVIDMVCQLAPPWTQRQIGEIPVSAKIV